MTGDEPGQIRAGLWKTSEKKARSNGPTLLLLPRADYYNARRASIRAVFRIFPSLSFSTPGGTPATTVLKHVADHHGHRRPPRRLAHLGLSSTAGAAQRLWSPRAGRLGFDRHRRKPAHCGSPRTAPNMVLAPTQRQCSKWRPSYHALTRSSAAPGEWRRLSDGRVPAVALHHQPLMSLCLQHRGAQVLKESGWSPAGVRHGRHHWHSGFPIGASCVDLLNDFSACCAFGTVDGGSITSFSCCHLFRRSRQSPVTLTYAFFRRRSVLCKVTIPPGRLPERASPAETSGILPHSSFGGSLILRYSRPSSPGVADAPPTPKATGPGASPSFIQGAARPAGHTVTVRLGAWLDRRDCSQPHNVLPPTAEERPPAKSQRPVSKAACWRPVQYLGERTPWPEFRRSPAGDDENL